MTVKTEKIAKLGAALAAIHRQFADGEKTTAIYYFGVKFGGEMSELSRSDLDAVSVAAGLRPVYGLELRKMVKLAPFVAVRTIEGA